MATANDEWVDVQKNTFTRWANTYLSRKRMEIDDLYVDLSDGIRLIALLQILCRDTVCKKYNKKPRLRIQKLENLNLAFTFMQMKGINLTNLGSSDIADGNQKLILGLLWTLIKSFQVGEIDVEGVSGKDGLLLWVNRSLVNYKHIEVKNFTNSWSNGMAFCALIHRFYPNVVDFDTLNPKNAQENVSLAFTIAYEKFGIPRLLEVNDVAGKEKPDEKSMMTYISLLFKEFASGVQKKKAVTTICKAVNIAQRHYDLSHEYSTQAIRLVEWLRTQLDHFETQTLPRRLTETKEKLMHHLEYKKVEKPPHEALFVSVEGCAGRWIASCKNNNRPIPVLEPSMESIQDMKMKLDELETTFEMNLRTNLEMFQKTELFLSRVINELEKVEAWAKEKEASVLFEDQVTVSSTSEAEEKLESVVFIREIELPRYKHLLASVVEHAQGLSAENAEAASAVDRVEAMKSFVTTVENKIGNVEEQWKTALRAQQEVDIVVKDCKALMRHLKYVIEEMDEEIEVSTRLQETSTDAVVAAKTHFETVVIPKVHQTVVNEKEKLIAKVPILSGAGRTTEVALIEKIDARVQRLVTTCNEKIAFFEDEVANVERRDQLCHAFANIAHKFKERCAQSTQAVNTVEGTLADQFSSMLTLRQQLFGNEDGKEDVKEDGEENEEEGKVDDTQEIKEEVKKITLAEEMDELEKINEELERLRVFTNPQTTETIHGLRAQFSSLENMIRVKIKSLEKEVALNELGNLTPQQVIEIREVFNHFDADGDGALARDEFIMACQGLGLNLSEEDCHHQFDSIGGEGLIEMSFTAFSKFCSEQWESGSSMDDVKAAFDILNEDNLTMSKIAEQFDAPLVEFIKKNQHLLMIEKKQIEGEDEDDEKEENEEEKKEEVLDYEKFKAFIFSL